MDSASLRKKKDWYGPLFDDSTNNVRQMLNKEAVIPTIKHERLLPKVLKRFESIPVLRMKRNHRTFLFYWHVLMLIGSLSLIGCGLFVTHYTDQYLLSSVRYQQPYINVYKEFVPLDIPPKLKYFYGSIPNEFGSAFTIVGYIYFFATCFYVSFLYHRVPFTWPILFLVTIIGLMITLSNILVRLSPRAQVSATQQKKMMDNLDLYKINNRDIFSVTYDYISIFGKCCGITSRYDFQTKALSYDYKGTTYPLQIPPTCCNATAFAKGFQAVVTCAKTLSYAYEEGCYNLFFAKLRSLRAIYVFAVLVLMSDIAIHIFIYRNMVYTLEAECGIIELNELEAQRRLEWDSVKKYLNANN